MSKVIAEPGSAQTIAETATELRVVLGKLQRRLREEARSADLTDSQRAVLSHLDRAGASTVSALAQAAGMRPQSMGATVSALTALGFVSGEPDPRDGRQTLLSLTPGARKTIKAVRAAREDWLHRSIEARLSAREQQTLAAGIELIKRLVDS